MITLLSVSVSAGAVLVTKELLKYNPNLFMINTLYIVLATYLVIKILRFPMINYANSKKRKFCNFILILYITDCYSFRIDI